MALLRASTPRETKERGEGVSGSPPCIPASPCDPSSPGDATRSPPLIFPFEQPPHSFIVCLHIPRDTEKRGGRHQATLATLQRPHGHLPPSCMHQHHCTPPYLHLHLCQTTRASALDVICLCMCACTHPCVCSCTHLCTCSCAHAPAPTITPGFAAALSWPAFTFHVPCTQTFGCSCTCARTTCCSSLGH